MEKEDIADGEVFASEEENEHTEHEKTEDIVQTYFHSMGNISVLKRNEEIELAKKLEEGKEIIKGVVTALPLYKKVESGLDGKDVTDLDDSEEETDEALEMSLKVLDNLMFEIEIADRKVARYGTLKDLRKVIRGKKERDINSTQLDIL